MVPMATSSLLSFFVLTLQQKYTFLLMLIYKNGK